VGATPGPLHGRVMTALGHRHGAGVTRFAHGAHGVTCELAVFVHTEEPVKFTLLSLTNHTRRVRD